MKFQEQEIGLEKICLNKNLTFPKFSLGKIKKFLQLYT